MTKPAFTICKARNGQYYFTFTTNRGLIAASSQMFTSKIDCQRAIDEVQECASIANIEDASTQEAA